MLETDPFLLPVVPIHQVDESVLASKNIAVDRKDWFLCFDSVGLSCALVEFKLRLFVLFS